MPTPTPFPTSYWVRPGAFLAGEHPTLMGDEDNRARMRALAAAGISVFLDLTEIEETAGFSAPAAVLAEVDPALAAGCQFHRVPIVDMEVPTRDEMRGALDLVDAALAAGRRVYVHCWAGIGRTGTLVGCYLARHGLVGEAAIAELARLRADTPDWRCGAPQRDVQRRMVLDWRAGE